MRNDAVHFENLLVRIRLGDVELPHDGCPVALTAAAARHKEKLGVRGDELTSNTSDCTKSW